MILIYPLDAKTITHYFGEDNSKHPIKGNYYDLFGKKHSGIDFGVGVGTIVKAALDGVVVRKEWHKGMGNVLGVRNGNIVILYAHLDKITVKLGKMVRQGEPIGLSGGTGNACDTPHLHFEARDISQPNLKEMVFDPPFGKEISQWKEEFEYKINNNNTPKTWKLLALRYFGDENKWSALTKENVHLNPNPDILLPDGAIVIVPNFENEQ